MNFLLLLCCSLISFWGVAQSDLLEPLKKLPFNFNFGDATLQLCAKFRVENFYGKNTEFLNNANEGIDQTVIPARHTFDLNTFYTYGQDTYGYNLITFKATIRNKANWGNPESIASTDRSTIILADVPTADHSHTLNRHFLWVRELWLEAAIGEMFNLDFANNHTFTAGFFPFELGRGIALGDAYTLDPDFLGFYSPNAVDQFAPGFKLSGAFDSDQQLNYDLYVAILVNRSDTLANVRRKLLGQAYDHQGHSARGFGVLNWLCAGRLRWHAYQCGEDCDLVIEPYAMFLDQREQKVEFLGDAESKLGTVGLSIDGIFGDVEWGFEFAQNLGRQNVKGWDRNDIIIAPREGDIIKANTQVIAIESISPDEAGKPALATPENELIIASSIRAQSQNGQQIGTSNLKNSKRRFRNPYTNHFDGYMAVWDASYSWAPGFKCAATAGIATGDIANPNRDFNTHGDSTADSTYSGFISVQEQYAGKRVNSAFLMSGAGKIPRILSFPSQSVDDPYPDKTSQFTNLIFTGVGLYADVACWHLNPNIISYWQEQPTRFFKRSGDLSSAQLASTWLGIEFNLFADICLDNSMKFYAVASVFVPGSHYSDLQGIPLNKAQKKFLDAIKANTVYTGDQVPLLGTNAAFTLNAGFEYRF